MTKYEFKQAIHLEGVDYPRGVHAIPEKAEQSAYFLLCVGDGLIVEPPEEKVSAPNESREKAAALLAKLVAKEREKEPVAPESKEEESAAEAAEEASRENEKPAGKGKRSKKNSG